MQGWFQVKLLDTSSEARCKLSFPPPTGRGGSQPNCPIRPFVGEDIHSMLVEGKPRQVFLHETTVAQAKACAFEVGVALISSERPWRKLRKNTSLRSWD